MRGWRAVDLLGNIQIRLHEAVSYNSIYRAADQLDDRVDATVQFSKDAAADGNGLWIVPTHPLRVFTFNQAITALTLAERLAHVYSYGDDDPFAKS